MTDFLSFIDFKIYKNTFILTFPNAPCESVTDLSKNCLKTMEKTRCNLELVN